jgi:preprotein translocase subunit YajC
MMPRILLIALLVLCSTSFADSVAAAPAPARPQPAATAQPGPTAQPAAIPTTPAPTEPAPARPAGSLLGSLLPLILIFAVLYFVMIMPQQRRQKKHQQMLRALKRGDRVVLSSGIFGIISEVKDATVMVKIAENTVIEVEKGAVTVKSGADAK